MLGELKIHFEPPSPFESGGIKLMSGVVGLYFIFAQDLVIPYPFKSSRLLYIGMSERKSTSIGTRLTNHFDGGSRNYGLKNYRKTRPLYYTIINFEMLRKFWGLRVEDLESYFIVDLTEKFGVSPICNNKMGSEVLPHRHQVNFNIDWDYFN